MQAGFVAFRLIAEWAVTRRHAARRLVSFAEAQNNRPRPTPSPMNGLHLLGVPYIA